jgi:hypothetical protein
MDLDQVLEELQANETQTKVATAPPKYREEQGGALLKALEKTAKVPEQPVVGHGDVVDDLVKMASELAGTEREAEVAHAALLGQAFADAAISKFASYEAKAAQELAYAEQQKVASYAYPLAPAPVYDEDQVTEEDLQKIAEAGYESVAHFIQDAMEKEAAGPEYIDDLTEDDVFELQKLAAEVGYESVEHMLQSEMQKEAEYDREAAQLDYFMKTASDDEIVTLAAESGYAETMEKIAADYQDGHDAALQEVHDVAMGEFLKGAAETEALINQLQAAQ